MPQRNSARSAARSALRPMVNGNIGGLQKTPGGKSGVELSTVTTSRKFRPASTGAITVAAGLEYRLDGGSWTSSNGTWGTSKYCEVRLTSSGSYSTAVTKAITINSVALNFSVATKADPNPVTDGWLDENGAVWSDESGGIWTS